jgi:molecular chaperone GrpE (heat shock protein)
MLLSLLDEYNVKKVLAEKYLAFDPLKHEVVAIVDDTEYDNQICDILQNGYTLYDQTLRYSKVTVFKKI